MRICFTSMTLITKTVSICVRPQTPVTKTVSICVRPQTSITKTESICVRPQSPIIKICVRPLTLFTKTVINCVMPLTPYTKTEYLCQASDIFQEDVTFCPMSSCSGMYVQREDCENCCVRIHVCLHIRRIGHICSNEKQETFLCVLTPKPSAPSLGTRARQTLVHTC